MPQVLHSLRHEAKAVMAGLLQGCRRVAVVAADDGPDLAQALSTRGTLHLLTTTGRTITCAQTTAGYDPAAVMRSNPDCIVVVAGGMTGWTAEQLQFRRTVVNDLHRMRIVMPVSNEIIARSLREAGINHAAMCPDLRFCCPVRQTPPFAGTSGKNAPGGPLAIANSESFGAGVDIQSAMRQLAPHPRIVTRDAGLSILAWMMGKETTLVLTADADAAKALAAAFPTATGLTLAESEPEEIRTAASTPSVSGEKKKIFIAVCTCQKNRHSRLPAIRSSWAGNLPPEVTLRFFLGGPPLPSGDGLLPDEILLDCPDTYDELPRKTFSILQYAANQVQFDHLIKIDDDTMVFDLQEMLQHVIQADYVGALKSRDMTALHHLRRQNSQNKSPVPPELLQSEFMTGPLYALSRNCVRYLAGLPRAHIRELQEAIAYEDRMIGRLITEAGRFSVFDTPALVRGYNEPAPVPRLYLATKPDRTIARTDYPVAAQRLISVMLRILPGRMLELVWNIILTNLDRIRRRI